MGIKKLTKLSILGISLTLALVLVLAPSLVDATHAGPSNRAPGAIFTTTPDGGIVNENTHYTEKIQVYLDGGPPPNAPAGSAGLDDHMYVFQITDPSGKVLLSDDPSKCRVIEVSTDGVIVSRVDPASLESLTNVNLGLSSTWSGGDCHVDDPPTPPYDPAVVTGVAGISGQHDVNVDVDHGVFTSDPKDAIVVQMMPFFDTPNPGGVYKAWVTPYETYLEEGLNCDGFKGRAYKECTNDPTVIGAQNLLDSEQDMLKKKGKQIGWKPDQGFGPSNHESKTDNFKVFIERPTPPENFPMIHVLKFHDINADGVRQFDDEPSIGPRDQNQIDPFTPNICVKLNGDIDTCPIAQEGSGGFLIWVTDPDQNTNQLATPIWITTDDQPGLWNIEEHLFPNWIQSSVFVANDPFTGDNLGVLSDVDVLVESSTGDADDIFITFGNYLPATVRGEKYHDLDADGMRDGGEPLWTTLGVDITLTCDPTVIPNTCSAADNETISLGADGKFVFTDKTPGAYVITETFPGGNPQGILSNDMLPIKVVLKSGDDINTATDVSGQTTNNQDFGNFLPGDVTGFKYEDKNANGVFDDPPEIHWVHGDVTITITCIGGECDDTTPFTDTTNVNPADGTFGFTGLIPGDYQVTESFDDPEIQSSDNTPILFTIESGESIDLTVDGVNNKDFGNYFLASIHGIKWEDRMPDGVWAPGEPGMEGVTINLDGIDGWQVIISSSTLTMADGMFWFEDLKPGSYTVSEVQPEGTIPTTDTSSGPHDLMSGQRLELGFVFGNFVGPCDGLTPGYWQAKLFDPANNQMNDYTFDQSILLITGTIVDDGALTQDDIDEALVILRLPDASNPLDKLEKFVLANQLTLNLTQIVNGDPNFPNTDNASLFLLCSDPENFDAGTLGELLALAIEYLNAGQATTDFNDDGMINDQDILDLKTVLDHIANLNF